MGITNEEAIRILEHARLMSRFPAKIKFAFDAEGIEALEMAIKALMQQLRDCKTCKHSDNGNCAGTEECHECMWESKYEQQPCGDCISREAVIKHICESKECYKDECKGRLYKRCFDLQWIYDLPSVTPQQRVGKWMATENEDMNIVGYYCSCCDLPMETEEKTTYCPNCGAKMEVEE